MLSTRFGNPTETFLLSGSASSVDTTVEVGDLLVALDTCRRDQHMLVGNTIKELYELSVKKGEDPVNYVKMALLTAFKRRNHNKSQAEGEGAGEILIFLHTIFSAIEIGGELLNDVECILPLVPFYGSWKDLRLIGEMILEKQIIDIEAKKEDQSISSGAASSSKILSTLSIPLNRVCKTICKLFADQLVADQKNMETITPTNACKYVPHYTRHFKNKKMSTSLKRKTEDEASESESEGEERRRGGWRAGRESGGGGDRNRSHDGAAAESEASSESESESGRRRRGGRCKGRERYDGGNRGRGHEGVIATPSKLVTEANGNEKARSVANIANCLLADEICRLACPVEFARKRGKAAFRKLRAGLNRQLVRKGHLIEPLMCNKQLEKINFNRACKGALTKYTAAIKKGGQSVRWMTAMQRNSGAVPDIDSLSRAAGEFLAEEQQEGDDAFKMFDMRINKAIKSIQTSRDKLVTKANELQAARLNKLSAPSSNSADEQSTVEVPVVGVVVDTAHCTDREARMSLVLAAYLLTRAQNLNHLVIDGVVHCLPEAILSLEGGEMNADPTTTFVAWLSLVPIHSADSLTSVARFQTGTSALLEALRENPSALSAGCDLVFICYDFAAYEEGKEQVHAHVSALQTVNEIPSVTLRTIRVHRMQTSLLGEEGEGGVAYAPRRGLRALPEDVSQVTADLAFLVDFTGSMGSYMAAVKSELVKVIAAIQSSVRCKGIRVALVGYRDYQDPGRVVTVEFHERENLQHLLDIIQNEQADGGGDAPEDLLSGLVAVDSLAWQSHVRLQVIITDANAHGYEGGHGDHHPSGKCPDQAADPAYPSLPQIMSTIADTRQVDTFFCQLGTGNLETQNAIADAYTDDHRGFGTVSIGHGADDFRDKIVACISQAIATTIAEIKVSGLQTADGVTLSSVMSSLNASLRESLLELGVSGSDEMAEEEEEEEEKELVESVDRVTGDDTSAAVEVAVITKTPTVKSKATKKAVPQTDYERLLRELELSELHPVRIALRLPVWSDAKLSLKSAAALYGAGVTASQLVAGSYPESIVNSFAEYLDGAFARV